jgi:hypothetical protein
LRSILPTPDCLAAVRCFFAGALREIGGAMKISITMDGDGSV